MDNIFSDVEQLIEQNQYEYSIFILTEMIDQNQKTIKALSIRCTCYIHLKRYKEAIEDAKKALSIDKTLVNAYIKLSKCNIALGQLTDAITALTSLKEIDPDNSYVEYELEKLKILTEYKNKAMKAYEEQNYKQVIVYMDKCLEKEKCIEFKLLKAECLVYLKKHSLALYIVNDILLTNKNDVNALYIRAINLIYQERYELGLAELKKIESAKATLKYEHYRVIFEQLQRDFHDNDNLDEVKKQFEFILTLDKNNTALTKSIHIKLANVNLKLKFYEESIIHCAKALEIEPDNLEALKIRARNNFEMQDYEDAYEDYKLLNKLDSKYLYRNILQHISHQLKNVKVNNYEMLGVNPTSSIDEIKKNYRKLALQYHPDKHSSKPNYIINKYERKFSKVHEAYQVIILHLNKLQV